ncbi:MAG: tetratricopeptide repeat protein [Spirochaetaceae bacterium]|jgi:tetratricopeptide (TPR) repeat protein|nr:tetratricopeptide repeat protein [Spirochaetaceae bacterium]
MKKLIFIFAAFFALCAISCSSKTDEETMRLYVRASAFFNEGKFNEAKMLLSGENSTKAINHFIPALVLRGKTEYFLNDYKAAEADFRAVLKQNSAHTDATLYLARIMRERGETAGALSLIEALLASDPNDVRVLRFAYELLRNSEEGEAASIAYLDRAVQAGTESAYVLLERARRHWTAGRTEEAISDLSGARALAGEGTALKRVIDNLEKNILEGIK